MCQKICRRVRLSNKTVNNVIHQLKIVFLIFDVAHFENHSQNFSNNYKISTLSAVLSQRFRAGLQYRGGNKKDTASSICRKEFLCEENVGGLQIHF